MQKRTGDCVRVLDLCSGLGGFTSGFVDCESWEILRIENNPLLAAVDHTEIICIFEFRDTLRDMINRGYQPDYVDLVVASPPCREFSNGYHAPKSIATREGLLEEYSPDMTLLECIVEIIDMLKPRFWIIENVAGSRKYFEPIVGEMRQKYGAFCFYGKYPAFTPVGKIKKKSDGDKWSSHPLRTNYRALIPKNISTALRKAVESQTTLFHYV